MVSTLVVQSSPLIHMPTQKLSPEILTAAIEGFEHQKARIDAQIAELRAMLSGGRTEPAATPAVPKGKRRKLSAAARKRIRDPQRKRWAESKGASEPSETITAKPKRKMSAAGRKAISEATKKRWAAFHAAKKVEKPAVAKKGAAKKVAAKKAAVKTLAKVAAKKTAVAKTAVKKSPKIAKPAEVPAVVSAQ
jgi:hypothetical protein